jgi:hypothetical protein
MILEHVIGWTSGKRDVIAIPQEGLILQGHTILHAGVNATRLETVDALAQIGLRIAPDAEFLFVPAMWAPLDQLGRPSYIDSGNAVDLADDYLLHDGRQMLRAAGLFVPRMLTEGFRRGLRPRILVSLAGIYALVARIMLHECGHYSWLYAMDRSERAMVREACRSSVANCTAWSAEFRNYLAENPQEWFCDAFADWSHLRLYRPFSPPPSDELERLFARIFDGVDKSVAAA